MGLGVDASRSNMKSDTVMSESNIKMGVDASMSNIKMLGTANHPFTLS
jgi:hypothetical protein